MGNVVCYDGDGVEDMDTADTAEGDTDMADEDIAPIWQATWMVKMVILTSPMMHMDTMHMVLIMMSHQCMMSRQWTDLDQWIDQDQDHLDVVISVVVVHGANQQEDSDERTEDQVIRMLLVRRKMGETEMNSSFV